MFVIKVSTFINTPLNWKCERIFQCQDTNFPLHPSSAKILRDKPSPVTVPKKHLHTYSTNEPTDAKIFEFAELERAGIEINGGNTNRR